MFDTKKISENHLQLYKTRNPDNRPSESFAQKSLNCSKPIECKRLVPLISISEMDPAYEKYCKTTNKSFEDMQNSILNPYHVSDIGYNIKNTESSLKRGSNFEGRHTYDSTDLAVLLSTLESQMYENFIGTVNHKSILQFDKQSDELSLQRLSGNILQACTETGSLLKTDVPENRRLLV